MSKINYRFWGKRLFPRKITTFFILVVLFIFPGLSLAEALIERKTFSDEYSMVFHPAAKVKTGEAEYRNIVNFFHKAEKAIETENLEALMALYSDKYRNRKNRDKKFAEGIWIKIFTNFDKLSARHSMKLITYEKSSGYQVVVTECSGILTGTPKGASRPVTIDSWDKQRHILINEGSWQLFGNAGESAKRYGEEDILTRALRAA